MTAAFSVRELRYLWTWAWLTPYRASIRKTPPTPRVQKVWRSRGLGFRLHNQRVNEHTSSAPIFKKLMTCNSTQTTHSNLAMRLPLLAFLQTSAMPPAWLAPTTMTANWPANITTVWNTSVHITAFRPPCEPETQDYTVVFLTQQWTYFRVHNDKSYKLSFVIVATDDMFH